MELPMIRWIEVVLDMTDVLNYEEFVAKCNDSKIEVISPYEYAQKLGLLLIANRTYKGISEEDSYMRFIEEMNKSLGNKLGVKTNNSGCCGGGNIR